MLDTARYALAFLLLATVPAAFCTWLLIHPFVRFWRRLGPARTFAMVGPIVVLVAAGVSLFTGRMLTIDFGAKPLLWPIALILYGIAIGLDVRCRKHLKFRILVGIPELEPGGHGGALISEGIYGRIRHPRYVSFFLGTTAAALFVNYLATYLLLPAFVGIVALIVHFEERELLDRFGEEYARYRGQVPRFVPRFR